MSYKNKAYYPPHPKLVERMNNEEPYWNDLSLVSGNGGVMIKFRSYYRRHRLMLFGPEGGKQGQIFLDDEEMMLLRARLNKFAEEHNL